VPAAQAPSGFSFSPVRLWSAALSCLSPSVPLDQVHQGGKQPHIRVMPHLDTSEDEAAARIKELHDTFDNNRYPFSDRIRTLKAILAKLRPEPARKPCRRRRSMPAAGGPTAPGEAGSEI
jgi:hypothetical protein